jgi:RNA polymerase sigma-70 factor (ECF subfamily)
MGSSRDQIHPSGPSHALLEKVPDERESVRQKSWDADAKLIQAAARGDASSQRELLECALPVARRTARYLLGPSQDVDDAVQASMLAVLKAAARFEGRSSMKTWVTRITTRTTLRLAQKQRTLVPVETLEQAQPARPAADGRSSEIVAPVLEYVERLPQSQREALLLRYALDYRVNEIAEVTECSPNTVKYRLKEALAKLRRMVRQDLAVRGAPDDD